MMNILFVHSIGKRKFWGGEKWLVLMASGLRQKGHRVIVGGRPGSRLLVNASRQGLETAGIYIISDINPFHIITIAGIIRKEKIDVVITRGRELAITGLASRLAGKMWKVRPVVLVRHGLPLLCSIRKHVFLLNMLADGIITNTHSIRELYEARGWVKKGFTRVIHNGTTASAGQEEYPFRELYPGRHIVLTAGRLALQKGYFYLIDAISILKQKRKDLLFFILGEGKLSYRLKSYARKRGVSEMIHFEGFVEDVSPYMKGCDIFVLPSVYEGMPNAAMEAMSYGRPVVLSSVYGSKELVKSEETGLLVPPRNPRAIAKALDRLAGDSQLRRRLGANARKHVSETFPVSKMVDRMEDYLKEKLEEKSSR